jgi:Transposase
MRKGGAFMLLPSVWIVSARPSAPISKSREPGNLPHASPARVSSTRIASTCSHAGSRDVRMGNDTSREIREQGYDGCDTLLRAFVTQLRKNLPVKMASRRQASSPIRTIPKTPREIRWLLAKHREDLDPEERAALDRLLQSSEEVNALRSLLHKFLNMIRQRKHEQLRSWMEAASTSGIPEIKSFVAGVERDYDAVKAGFPLLMVFGVRCLERLLYRAESVPCAIGEWTRLRCPALWLPVQSTCCWSGPAALPALCILVCKLFGPLPC